MSSGRRIERPSEPSSSDDGGTLPAVADELAQAGAELAALVGTVRACERCPRAAERRTFGSGHPLARVFLLKAAPSDDDLRTSAAFTTEADALQKAFDRLAIPPSWVYGTTAVRCGTADPDPDDVRACSAHLLVELEVIRPKVVVAFGDAALEALRALDGRCGISVPDEPPRGEPFALREGLVAIVTEDLPAGITDPAAKRRLWRDLQRLPEAAGTGARTANA